jgi:hypothetical protein
VVALSLAFIVLAVWPSASRAQTVPDPDFWKQTTEHQQIVDRFVYSQSPQPIPSSYDPVQEAEEILRSKQAGLSPSNPTTQALWQRIRTLTIKEALSTRLGAAGTIGLVALTGYVGVRIGSGIYAKYFEIESPPAAPWNSSWPQEVRYLAQGTNIYPGLYMPYDGWAWEWNPGGYWRNFWVTPTANGTAAACPSDANPSSIPDALSQVDGAPHPNCNSAYNGGGDGGIAHAAAVPENELRAHSPILDYSSQSYDYWFPTPPAPSQAAVEDGIETELGEPGNALLTQWLNYTLGSPGETDPTGQHPQNAEIEFPGFEEHWEDHEDEFPEYGDPWEYWQGAVEVVERGERGGEGVDRCERDSDGAIIYWDIEKATIVVIKDGKIVTYFKPDDADAYWLANCS